MQLRNNPVSHDQKQESKVINQQRTAIRYKPHSLSTFPPLLSDFFTFDAAPL
jgi:hypothetical protein